MLKYEQHFEHRAPRLSDVYTKVTLKLDQAVQAEYKYGNINFTKLADKIFNCKNPALDEIKDELATLSNSTFSKQWERERSAENDDKEKMETAEKQAKKQKRPATSKSDDREAVLTNRAVGGSLTPLPLNRQLSSTSTLLCSSSRATSHSV